jgi:hypothetical protein
MINIRWGVCRNIVWAFSGRGRLFSGRIGGSGIAGIFRRQTLLESLIRSCGLRSGRASWEASQSEQREGDFNFHDEQDFNSVTVL